jgi:Domain of unknown function (DUF4328)
MDLLWLLALGAPAVILSTLMWLGTLIWPYPRTAPLRREIQAQVCFATTLDRASLLGTRGFGDLGSTRGRWIPLQGTKRLTVGTSAFMVSAPRALKQFAFRGCECSIGFTRLPSRPADRDWIVITGQSGGRLVQLAITNHNLPATWQALAAAGASLAGNEVSAGGLTTTAARPVRSRRYSLRGLAAGLEIVLIVDAASWLGAIALPWLGNPGSFGALVAVVMFVVWFYRARINADGHGWPQRRSPGLAIWAWFAPVINLYIPFQIMADIWRAGLPAEARSSPAKLAGTWWTCLLALLLLSSVTPGSAAQVGFVGIPVKLTGVLAEIMTALLVQKVSSGPLGRKTEPSDP